LPKFLKKFLNILKKFLTKKQVHSKICLEIERGGSRMLEKIRKVLEWFEKHESLITALINLATALILLGKAI